MKINPKKGFLTLLAIIIGLSSIGVVAADTLTDSLWVDTNMCSEVDPITGLTCDEIEENPDQDIYYVVSSSHFDDAIWAKAHQDPETVRWDAAHIKFIVKYNSNEIPRDEFGLEKALGAPMTHDEIMAYLGDPLNGFFDPDYYIDHPLMPVVPLEEIMPILPEELLPAEQEVPIVEEEVPTEITPEVDMGEVLGEETDLPEEGGSPEEVVPVGEVTDPDETTEVEPDGQVTEDGAEESVSNSEPSQEFEQETPPEPDPAPVNP